MTIYIYVKTHKNTGLKYLGKTKNTDPHLYPGSGVYWQAHLKKHGKHFDTEILRECQTKEEVKEWGLYYSNLWNVAESEEWANFMPESGEGGATKGMTGKTHSEETKKKMSIAHKDKQVSQETRQKMSNWQKGRKRPDLRGKTPSDETRKKLSDALTGYVRGPMPDEQKNKLSKKLKGRVMSEETKKKMSDARKKLWAEKKRLAKTT